MEIRTTQVSMAVYPDEISFHASEFIGLTEQEAHALRHRKDVAYVLCPGWSGGDLS